MNKYTELTIAVGNTLSNSFFTKELIQEDSLVRIDCPLVLTAITSISLQYSNNNVDWRDLKDEYGIPITIAVSAASAISIPPRIACILPKYIRIKSNAAASGNDRTFALYFRKV